MAKKKWVDWCWDSWCVLSLIGIWPRFVEPQLLAVTKIQLPLSGLSNSLEGLKILQFSDLHWNAKFSPRFRKKIIKKINLLQPDIIVFTGDFLIRSIIENGNGLQRFLSSLNPGIGFFAVLGNHDYDKYVTVNCLGDYDIEENSRFESLYEGFKRLFRPVYLSGKISQSALHTNVHQGLINLLENTSIRLLHNETATIYCKGSGINICGLGEYTAGKCLPKKAFQNYKAEYPGIILTHNPDSIPELMQYPGEIILSGHTHGGQINLPVFREKFTRIEQRHLMRGLKKLNGKWIYINRGVGSTLPFRWRSVPELTLFRLIQTEP